MEFDVEKMTDDELDRVFTLAQQEVRLREESKKAVAWEKVKEVLLDYTRTYGDIYVDKTYITRYDTFDEPGEITD